jgi:uncharacterized protein YggE
MRTLIVLLTALPMLCSAQAAQKNFIDQNYIEVTGQAEMKVLPDLIYLSIRLDERDAKTRGPLEQTERKMIDKLKEIGIDVARDFAVRDLASNFRYYLMTKGSVDLSKQYTLIVHSGKQAMQAIVELEKLGISNIDLDRMDHTKIHEYREQVKVEALKAAHQKAKAMVNAIQQNIGRAIYVEELNDDSFRNTQENRALLANTGVVTRGISNSDSPDFDRITLDYRVLVRFELK